MLGEISRICDEHGLKVANIFHAGDGNLHPLILYDANDADQADKAERAGAEVLELCVAVGGCLTGEHGVGIEKRDLMRVQFDASDLEQQMRVKTVFDPNWLLNPAKVFPLEGRARGASEKAESGSLRRRIGAKRRAPGRRTRGRADFVARRRQARTPLELKGGGSKHDIGRPMTTTLGLSTGPCAASRSMSPTRW